MRFCGNCGSKLPSGSSLPSGTKLPEAPTPQPATVDPAQLGVMMGTDLLERFRQAGLEASGQRRSVTVLFVDLTGYTHLSEELSDEELYELVQKFIRLLVDAVYKYEGMVDKLTGDGLMALFGAPIAYENNAERALRSALEMQESVTRLSQELDLHGYELRIHVGLNAGTVIVGGLGSNGLMNYTAIGDSVNLARRLEETAGPGTVLVSESVYRQTSRLFDFELLPPLALKNVSHEVTAYRAIGPKERPGLVRGLEGLRAPMIGRETEFRQAQAVIDRLAVEKQGGVILLVGEGGMGKSRLTSELKARLDSTRVRVLEGHSLTYRKAVPYWIFQDMLRGYLGLPTDAPEAEVRRRLSQSVQAALGAAGREKLPYLEHLLALEPQDLANPIRYLDPGQLRQAIFLAMRDLLLAEARRCPLLLVLEDLHWADDASLDLIRFLLDSTRGDPLLIYAISRPFEGGAVQAIHERASQRLADRYVNIRLQALPPDQSAQLLQALVTIQDLPETLRAQIIERSAGLPFYLEEILRMLIENNIIFQVGETWRVTPGADTAAVGVPETLQGLILTRFDRLTPTQRRILQTASVVGYQFSGPVLFHVLCSPLEAGEYEHSEYPLGERALDEHEAREALNLLIEREFVVPQASEDGQNGGPAEDRYLFKHVLVSDAVYSTLLQRDRRDLHTRAGLAIEQLYADRLDSQMEVLASHFLRSPLLVRALHYLTLAGQKAARSYSNEQARLYFTQALEVLPKTEHTAEQAVAVYLGLGDALLISGEYPEAREHFARALEVIGGTFGTGILRLPDSVEQNDVTGREARIRLVSEIHRKIGQTHERQGDYEKALTCLNKAQELIDHRPGRFVVERASILNDIGYIDFRRGRLERAETLFQQGLELAESSGQLDLIGSILNRMAGIYFQRDDVEQAARYLVRSLVLREQIGDVVAVARSYNNLGLLGWKQGDLVSALENFDHSYKLQANLGDVEGLIVLHTNMGLIELDRGNLPEAENHFQEALETAGLIGHFFYVCLSRMHLALLNVFAQNWPRVIEHGQLGLRGFQELGVQDPLLDLNVSLGWAYLGLQDEARLAETTQRIESLIEQQKERQSGDGPSEGEGRALRLFARIARQCGDAAEARGHLEKSAAIFAQVGNQMERARVQVDLASLLAAEDPARARATLAEANEVLQRMGAQLEIERATRVAREISGLVG